MAGCKKLTEDAKMREKIKCMTKCTFCSYLITFWCDQIKFRHQANMLKFLRHRLKLCCCDQLASLFNEVNLTTLGK